MLTQQNNRRALLVVITCLAATGAPNGEAFGEQIKVSWQATAKTTADDGNTATREGTATFANGEKALLVSRVAHNFGSGSGTTGGTNSAVTEYKFDDGSGFTLRSVGIFNSIIVRTAGLFTAGHGRFAGITGGATGEGDLRTLVWTGAYELPSQK